MYFITSELDIDFSELTDSEGNLSISSTYLLILCLMSSTIQLCSAIRSIKKFQFNDETEKK